MPCVGVLAIYCVESCSVQSDCYDVESLEPTPSLVEIIWFDSRAVDRMLASCTLMANV